MAPMRNLSDRIDPLVSVQIRFTFPLSVTVHPVFRYYRIAGRCLELDALLFCPCWHRIAHRFPREHQLLFLLRPMTYARLTNFYHTLPLIVRHVLTMTSFPLQTIHSALVSQYS
jgi:hypothetical protein